MYVYVIRKEELFPVCPIDLMLKLASVIPKEETTWSVKPVRHHV